MKTIGIFLLAGMLCWGCDWMGDNDPAFDYNRKSAEVIDTNNDFGLALFRAINAKETSANMMMSPTSVSLALGMAYNGAEGTTREAFDEVLNYEGLSRDEVNGITRDLINTLVTNSKGNLLEIANSVWYRNGFPVYDAFIEMNRTYFAAEVEDLDFSSPKAVETINEWVAEKTHDKIKKVINELSPESMMVLINALYFNCLWETEFDPDETGMEMFYNEDLTQYGEVEMMTTEATFNYAATDDFTAVELPYKNGKFSMRLFLPAGDKTVNDLISQLDGREWNNWLESFEEHDEVQVTMPKFKFEYERSIGEDLQGLGLGVAFTDQADFSGISDIDLLISDVIHKTYVDVNEKGTEAAAVTAIVFETTSVGPSGPVVIKLDRPFLFTITENSSKAIMFAGKLGAPEYE